MAMKNCFYRASGQRTHNDLARFLPADVEVVSDAAELARRVAAARRGECRVFAECPEALDGLEFGGLRHAEPLKARSVVTDGWSTLAVNQILLQHNFAFREVRTPVVAHVAAARVAGYRDACFGLPEEQFPLLFHHPECAEILVATTGFSGFIHGRFAPCGDWGRLIGAIVGFLRGDDRVSPVEYAPEVRPSFDAAASLPADAEAVALERCTEWFYREMIAAPQGKYMVFEGFSSVIDTTGRQWLMPGMRGDCMGEALLVTALDGARRNDPTAHAVTDGLLDTIFKDNLIRDDNPASQTYGGLLFYERIMTFYGDDNSRAGFGAVLAGELTGRTDCVKNILELAYMLLRTTNASGLRRPTLYQPYHFTKGRGWKYYRETDTYAECHPHYQAFQWAFLLQMYELTQDRDFLESAENGMGAAMAVFPDFYWQNGVTPDWARLLLPFAMLVEVADTPRHREWLGVVCDHFIALMNRFGVVGERTGDPARGQYPAPRTNAEYGTREAALIQRDGDPLCDSLYTMNFAFAGMHEAWIATGEARYRAAADRMAEFFCRTQVRSTAQGYLDGCWMRGFDFELWDYGGNASDSGWGPWCVESGWTNAWIAATMGLRGLNRGLLSRKQRREYMAQAAPVKRFMFDYEFPSTTRRGTFTEVNTYRAPEVLEAF